LSGSHGVAIDTATGLGFADSSKTRTISIFSLKTLAVSKTIPALEDADGMVFDRPSNQVFTVGGDANALLAVDAAHDTALSTIALGGSPESQVSDQAGSVYVNINDKNELVRISTKTDAITARWPLPGCQGPVGLAIDTADHVLFSSCANAVMSVVNGETGAILATLPIGKGTDSADFDAARKLAFSSNRDGTLSVISEVSPTKFIALPAVQTAPGARTLAVDESTGRIFLVTAKVVSAGPPRHPGGAPDYAFAPGSLKLLVYAPNT
jgi:DNA-binding beta-propeller fold protein YncE